MSLLRCPHCREAISATHKHCPHCGHSISLLGELKAQVERNRLWQVLMVVAIVLLLGLAWFWRMDSGNRWPLYILLVLVAPLVPWLLKLAYKSAAPLDEDTESATKSSSEPGHDTGRKD